MKPLILLLSVLIAQIVSASERMSYFQATSGPQEARGDLWRPALSFFLPGADQYLAGHYYSGAAYSGLWLLGYNWSSNVRNRIEDFEGSDEFRFASKDERENFLTEKDIYQEWTYSSQLTLVASGMSAYHAFRTSVESRRHLGEYQFLPTASEETPMDVALAPFEFKHLTKPTTLVPLGVITVLALNNYYNKPEGYEASPFTFQESVYTAGLSYNAGTNEEALFRGWIMPYAMEHTGSYFLSNLIQSSVFAAAHIGQTQIPIVQLSLGYYLGWLTYNNHWTMSESIFIHTWWDVLAFAMQYNTRKETAVLSLPALNYVF